MTNSDKGRITCWEIDGRFYCWFERTEMYWEYYYLTEEAALQVAENLAEDDLCCRSQMVSAYTDVTKLSNFGA